MKSQNIRILQTIALAAGIAVGASAVSAAGLLGERYVSATLDYVNWDNDVLLNNGRGATFVYNQPLNQSIDLSAQYSYLRSGMQTTSGHVSGNLFGFSGTWYSPSQAGKIYVRAGLGWADTNVSDNETLWDVEVGYELLAGKTATVTPFVSYTDGFKRDVEHSWDFGVRGEIAINKTWSWLLTGSVDDSHDWQFSTGAALRF